MNDAKGGVRLIDSPPPPNPQPPPPSSSESSSWSDAAAAGEPVGETAGEAAGEAAVRVECAFAEGPGAVEVHAAPLKRLQRMREKLAK